jgi:glucokinase
VARVDRATGQVLASARAAWVERTPEAVVRTLTDLLRQVETPETAGAPLGVGFAAMVRGGTVVNAPAFGWRGVELGPLLEAATGRSVRLVNDLSAAAWGEHKAGVARGVDDTFTVFVGTGVGSAIISGGQLVRGATGVAAEFGHVKVLPEGGAPCGCGEQGCLEAYMGGQNLTHAMQAKGLTGTPYDLEQLAHTGNPEARALYDFAVGQLALQLANQVTVLNPAMVVLGGGVLSRCPGMVARVRAVIARRAGAAARGALKVELASLGDDAGLVGAALLA